MWWDQPPQIPASVPFPPRCSISSWMESTETLHPEVAFLGYFVLEILQVTDAQDAPENTLFRFVLCIYIAIPLQMSLEASSLTLVNNQNTSWSLCVLEPAPLAIYIQNLGSCNHFRVLPFLLQCEQEPQPATAQPSSPFSSSSLMHWPAI